MKAAHSIRGRANYSKWAGLAFSALLLIACGGGGSNPSNPSNPGTQPPDNVNGELKGHLYVGNDSQYLDLSTGWYTVVAPDDTEYTIYPSADGTERLIVVEDFRHISLGRSNDLIKVVDAVTGLTKDRFELSESVVGAAKLSPDHQIIAAIWRDESSGEDFDDERLTLFSRTGQVLSRSSQRDVSSFDWLPDGRLVYTIGQSIHITSQPKQVGLDEILVTFPDAQGRPGYIAASPDGKMLAFELITGGTPSPFIRWRDATVWTINVDGTGLRMMATTDEDKPRLNRPAWSPDGKWLVVSEGYIGGVTPVYDPFEPGEWRWEVVQGIPGVLLAFAANQPQTINFSTETNSQLVKAIAKRYGDGYRPASEGYSPVLRWISPAQQPPEVPGTLPANSGAFNQGLVGTLYFDDDGLGDTTALHALDLQSPGAQNLFKLTNDDLDNVRDKVYLSRDGQLVSHLADDSPDKLYVYDRSGQHLGEFPMEAGNYDIAQRGPARFSPVDSDLLLVAYRDYYSGSPTITDDFVAVINWKTGVFVKDFLDREYVAGDWTPNGDIILAASDGRVYKATASASGFSSPQLLFSRKDPAYDLTISPDGNRLACYMAGQIWTSHLDGSGLKRLTAYGSQFHALPEWSPDSRFIAFKSIDSNDTSTDSGEYWVVPADAENVRVGLSPQAIPLYRDNTTRVRVFGTVSWR